ncbi:hypothetical protein [Streptomyces lavendulae]|uniref:hypothetical protein n=1 Tax=Streptomyces lavendulae TaxID=1914 RepID=UPI0024A01A45|nr:hypothetical protein [Streptomyces lavendulae]GLW04381.1 hypothetical protein Slala05_80110 [Streptomyces lavendulae subsp. lavendulae]
MVNQGDPEQSIRTLADDEAVRALTALAEEHGLLPAARELSEGGDELRAEVAAVELERYVGAGQSELSEGELARRVLEYAAALREDLADTVGEAVAYARSPMERFEPVTLPVAALVIALLQTEVVLKRDPRGRWSLTIHKRALRDSALGRVLTALLSQITSGK